MAESEMSKQEVYIGRIDLKRQEISEMTSKQANEKYTGMLTCMLTKYRIMYVRNLHTNIYSLILN